VAGLARIAEVGGEAAGALIVSENRKEFAPPVDEPGQLFEQRLQVGPAHPGT
jgi:hypothetical protein